MGYAVLSCALTEHAEQRARKRRGGQCKIGPGEAKNNRSPTESDRRRGA